MALVWGGITVFARRFLESCVGIPSEGIGRDPSVTIRILLPDLVEYTVGCDRNRMANLSKASNVVQEKYILYDVTGFTQKWHSIPIATGGMLRNTWYVTCNT